MSLVDKVQKDMIGSMKAHDKEKASVLRMLLSRLQLEAKEAGGELDEDREIKVLMAEKKKRMQSAEAFHDVGRDDRASLEEAEAAVIDTYLPQAMDEAELQALVERAIADADATEIRDMGKVMALLMPAVAGRADGRALSEMVKRKLSGK